MTGKFINLFIGLILCAVGLRGCYGSLMVLATTDITRTMSGGILFGVSILITYRGYSIINGEEIGLISIKS